jgi:MFS family permease
MVAVVFGALMSMLDTTIVNIAIRTLSVRLRADLSSVQWVVIGYLFALAGGRGRSGGVRRRVPLGTRGRRARRRTGRVPAPHRIPAARHGGLDRR